MKALITALAAGAMLLAGPKPAKEPLRGHIIVVDPGHGGRDSGARAGDLYESDVVLAISKEVAAVLRQEGAKVVMTRADERNLIGTAHGGNLQRLNLAARVEVAAESKADLFLSLHANKYVGYPAAHGAQVFLGETPTAEQKKLAVCLMNELGPLTDSKRPIDDRRPLYLMRHLKTPAALLELGFLSNPRETGLMTQPAYQRQLAAAIAKGVDCYFHSAASPGGQPPQARRAGGAALPVASLSRGPRPVCADGVA